MFFGRYDTIISAIRPTIKVSLRPAHLKRFLSIYHSAFQYLSDKTRPKGNTRQLSTWSISSYE